MQLRSGRALCPAQCKAKASGWSILSTVHAAGLKLGIYTDSGSKTCAKYSGSLGFEEEDAAQIAAWGVDLLKVCACMWLSSYAQSYL